MAIGELRGRQLELLQALVATGTPAVLLVMNGRTHGPSQGARAGPVILDTAGTPATCLTNLES